jgi:lipid II isoglutaminyl synthase (glutamine-hydrolysing)
MAELTLRDRAALGALRAVNTASRRTRRGEGTVAGGRVALRLSPGLARRLAAGVDVALVSGTNGKTTTTACLAAALAATGPVATNATGANMLPGHVAALDEARDARRAALECDEIWLAAVLAEVGPKAVVLLNLSRDQLDRTSEVRRVAEAWRTAMADFDGWCVANADDPLVAHAALAAPRVAWFAGGLAFRGDATTCPACRGHVTFDERGWRCVGCGRARPTPDAAVTATGAVVDGTEVPYELCLPGRFNQANAVAALLCARRLGVPLADAAAGIASLREVAGRFSALEVDGVAARLLLAKNPAGWSALLDLVAEGSTPVVVAVNARVADGRDPSWLYDVDFERLAGRRVVASGERWRDVAARLFYAGVDHEVAPDPRDAILVAGAGRGAVDVVDVVANYTAFASLREPG